MSFTFPVMTEEEIKAMNLVEDGIYDFEIVKAEQKTSKSGNPMIELLLMIWDKEGKEHTIFDYLVSIKSMMYKIKHFCDSTKLEKEYQSGTFRAEQCVGLRGKAHIIIQEGQSKPDGGKYPDKNAVKDYVMTDKSEVKVTLQQSDPTMNDDLPF